MTLKLAVSRSRPPVLYGANLFFYQMPASSLVNELALPRFEEIAEKYWCDLRQQIAGSSNSLVSSLFSFVCVINSALCCVCVFSSCLGLVTMGSGCQILNKDWLIDWLVRVAESWQFASCPDRFLANSMKFAYLNQWIQNFFLWTRGHMKFHRFAIAICKQTLFTFFCRRHYSIFSEGSFAFLVVRNIRHT